MGVSKNSKANFSLDLLSGILEQTIFDKSDSKNLISAINKLESREIESEDLKSIIIASRAEIVENLLEVIPFYVKQMILKDSIGKSQENLETGDLEDDLKQKNDLLRTVGHRINNIYIKLRRKQKFDD
jgi:hypothetical protein